MEQEQFLLESNGNPLEFRDQTDKLKFGSAIKQITRILRSCHPTYDGTKYIFRQVRGNLDLKTTQKKRGVREHLTREEAERIISIAYERKGHIGLLIKTLLFTGCRVNEFVHIRMEDIYLSEAKIIIKQGKGDKARFVPIFSFLLHELSTYIADRQEGFLFESNRHDRFSTRRIEQILRELAVEAGISKPVYPHMLRRTIATWLRDRKVPLEQIQMFLGHEKIETTLIYAQGSIAGLTEDMNRALTGGGPIQIGG